MNAAPTAPPPRRLSICPACHRYGVAVDAGRCADCAPRDGARAGSPTFVPWGAPITVGDPPPGPRASERPRYLPSTPRTRAAPLQPTPTVRPKAKAKPPRPPKPALAPRLPKPPVPPRQFHCRRCRDPFPLGVDGRTRYCEPCRTGPIAEERRARERAVQRVWRGRLRAANTRPRRSCKGCSDLLPEGAAPSRRYCDGCLVRREVERVEENRARLRASQRARRARQSAERVGAILAYAAAHPGVLYAPDLMAALDLTRAQLWAWLYQLGAVRVGCNQYRLPPMSASEAQR